MRGRIFMIFIQLDLSYQYGSNDTNFDQFQAIWNFMFIHWNDLTLFLSIDFEHLDGYQKLRQGP